MSLLILGQSAQLRYSPADALVLRHRRQRWHPLDDAELGGVSGVRLIRGARVYLAWSGDWIQDLGSRAFGFAVVENEVQKSAASLRDCIIAIALVRGCPFPKKLPYARQLKRNPERAFNALAQTSKCQCQAREIPGMMRARYEPQASLGCARARMFLVPDLLHHVGEKEVHLGFSKESTTEREPRPTAFKPCTLQR